MMADSALSVRMVTDQLQRRAPGGIATYTNAVITALQARSDVVVHECKSRMPVRLLGLSWQRGLFGPPVMADTVTHSPSLLVPPKTANLVITVHDLLWRDVPDAFPARARRWHEWALHAAIDTSAAIIVPASVTRDRLIDAGADAERVHVVAEGADHLPEPDLATAGALLASLGIERFVFSVSTLEPRKNFVRLMDAFGRLRDEQPDLSLVIAGPAGWGPALKPVPGTHLIGTVPGEVLAALYRLAALTAYVPLAEGFGLPPLEAMAQGCAVVVSPMPSVPGEYPTVSPDDTQEIADDILWVLNDSDERDKRVALGRVVAGARTWAAAGEKHVAIYKSVLQ